MITLNTNSFKAVLKALRPALDTSGVIPILECYRIEVSGGMMFVKTNNTDIDMTTAINIADEHNVVMCVPGKILFDTINSITADTIHLIYDESTLTIKAGKGKYKMSLHDTSEWPDRPAVSDSASDMFNITTDDLHTICNDFVKMTSSDELRPAMTGVNCVVAPNKYTLYATDANRLMKKEIECGYNSPKEYEFIFPKNALKAINGMDGCMVSVYSGHISFDGTINTLPVKVNCTRMNAKFPNCEQVIPIDHNQKFTVNRQPLKDALNRVSLYGNNQTNLAVFDVIGNALNISATDLNFGRNASEQLQCNSNGDIRIGFNAKYLLSIIDSIESELITFFTTSATQATVIKGDDYNTLFLLMPVMIETLEPA